MARLSELVVAGAPIEAVALAIAADVHPGLVPARYLEALDALAAPLGTAGDVEQLCRRVYQELGFRGDEDYGDPRSNLLDEVIERRCGSPVSLAVVLMAIARRAGVEVQPIAFPGNFLVRCEGAYMDPFDGRRPLPYGALLDLATNTLGSRREAIVALEPVGPRTVAVRLLQNLLRIHQARGDHAWALVTCDRLFELTNLADLRADRGAHALATGALRTAIADFAAYLAAHPGAPDADRVRSVMRRAQELVRPAN